MLSKHRLQVKNAIIEIIESDNEGEETYLNVRFDRDMEERQIVLQPRHAKALASLIQGDV